MDYYEELGINPSATEDEIRKAHRRLAKLFHPDQQTDEGMKAVAERQMRRLNSIVDVLTDPEQRRVYDEQLREGLIPYGPVPMHLRAQAPPPRRLRHALPWWAASTVAAVLVTVGAVWFWAGNWGSSFGGRTPTYIPSEATTSAPANAQSQATSDPSQSPGGGAPAAGGTTAPGAAPPGSAAPVAPTPAPTVQVERHQSAFARFRNAVLPHRPESRTVQRVPAADLEAAPATPVRKPLHLAMTNVAARPAPVHMNLPPPPSVQDPATEHVDTAGVPMNAVPTVTAKPPDAAPAKMNAPTRVIAASVKAVRQNPLEGEWVYAPTQPEKKRPGFYPPEFIDLRLAAGDGGLHGQYRARYNVTDKPISPDVSFTLHQDGNNKFTWQSSNGSRGILKVTSIEGTNMHIEWKTTVFSKGLALTAGTATLVKREQ